MQFHFSKISSKKPNPQPLSNPEVKSGFLMFLSFSVKFSLHAGLQLLCLGHAALVTASPLLEHAEKTSIFSLYIFRSANRANCAKIASSGLVSKLWGEKGTGIRTVLLPQLFQGQSQPGARVHAFSKVPRGRLRSTEIPSPMGPCGLKLTAAC